MGPHHHYQLDQYDYTSVFDMYQLANRIDWLSDEQFNKIAPHIMGTGLMRTRWYISLGVALIKWRHGVPEHVAWIVLGNNMRRYNINLFSGLKSGVIKHMTVGDDKSDARSAGGFNAREIETLSVLVNTAEAL